MKPYYDAARYVGIACAMKNAGVGVGLPDTGRCRLAVEGGKVHILPGPPASARGWARCSPRWSATRRGSPGGVVYERANTYCAPDAGTTSGSRQTLFTGEAVRRACQDLKAALSAGGLEA